MSKGIIVSPANRGVQVVVTDENNVQLLVDSNRGVNLEIVPQPRIEVLVDKGVEGAQGPVGPQGPQGPQGTAATVTAGTTTTGAAGTNAIVTNSGTSSAAVFDFTIPRGDTGATGAGVATGGTTGQVLVKASNANYDTTWATITGTLVYQGSWNASTNTPTLTSSVGTNGYYYVVGTSGSTNLNGITDWVVGDWAIFNGSVWQKIDNTDLVSSVNGQTGVVVLDAADVGALSTLTSTDGSVTITSPNATTRDLSVAISGSTTNVVCLVRNTTGATLTKGTVVYISGATGQNPTVSKAIATGDATSAQTLGMMTADLANNTNGYVTIIGLITNIDTSAYTDGEQLYLSGTVAGAVTGTKPFAPIHLVYVAVVEYAHPTQGKLFVKVQNGYELDEIHDVSIVSPTTGQTLVYNATNDLWENSNAPVISGTTINNTVIGGTTPAAGTFTTLTATGNTNIGTGLARYLVAAGSASGSPGMYATAGSLTFSGGTSQGINFYSSVFTAIQFNIAHTASAVNYVQVTGAATGSYSIISAQGSDTNTGLIFQTKGTGYHRFSTGGSSTNEQLRVLHTASTANRFELTGSAASSSPVFSVAGSDTNIDLNLTTKGTGSFKINNAGGTVAEFNDGGAANPTNSFLFAAGGGGIRALIRAMGGSMTLLSTGTNPVNFATNGSSGNIQAVVSHTASAVNYVQVTGAATGSSPQISSQGSDTNIGLQLRSKGTGAINLMTQGGLNQAVVFNNGNGTTFLGFRGGNTGVAPLVSAEGSDTNIPLVLQPKGTGALQAQQTDSTATGGNARGANAVDWQTTRDSAAKVASGSGAFLGGGYASSSQGQYSVVVGGALNAASGESSFIGSGSVNSASQQKTVTVGGNSNSSTKDYAAVVGGQSNTASGYFNFIGGGASNTGTANAAVTTQSGTMNGTTAVTLSGSNANIKVGQLITGTSIATWTYVAAISGTSLTLSQAASGSSTSTLSFYTPHGVVVGGGNNQATGSYSFIGGGGDAGTAANRNVASGDWSSVLGGTSTRATGKWSTAVGGGGNQATGEGAVVVGGGSYGGGLAGSVASGTSSFIGAGYGNTSGGYCSTVVGGSGNTAINNFSFVGGGTGNSANAPAATILGGYAGTTRSIVGMQTIPACAHPITTTQGITQAGIVVLARQTTDATSTVLCSDSTAASTTNQVILPNNSAYTFRGEIVSGVTGGGNSKSWTIEGLIKRGANAASTTLVGSTVTSMYADVGAVTWTIALSADTTNGGLAVTFTGQASTTIRTVCRINTVEMTY